MASKKRGNRKTPKSSVVAGASSPRQQSNPTSYLSERPVWAFRSFDWEGEWGEAALSPDKLRKHFEHHLAGFESMTWAEILEVSGGKKVGTNHHSLAVSELSKKARDRIDFLRLRVEEVFSLRLEGAIRLYGIKEGREFRVLWFDPFHSDERKAVCPSRKRGS